MSNANYEVDDKLYLDQINQIARMLYKHNPVVATAMMSVVAGAVIANVNGADNRANLLDVLAEQTATNVQQHRDLADAMEISGGKLQ